MYTVDSDSASGCCAESGIRSMKKVTFFCVASFGFLLKSEFYFVYSFEVAPVRRAHGAL